MDRKLDYCRRSGRPRGGRRGADSVRVWVGVLVLVSVGLVWFASAGRQAA